VTTDKKKAAAPCTKEDLVRLRDTEQNSWAKVAQALGLGSPGGARRAYTALVRPHTESTLAGRAQGEAAITPVHLADADLATIREAIAGRTIVVQRTKGTEDVTVAKVTSLKDGTVNLNDGNKSRSIKAAAIIAVR
jgi:hypothetical protein